MGMTRCELCGSEGVRLSSGLAICGPCFWTPGKLSPHWVNRRFSSARTRNDPPKGAAPKTLLASTQETPQLGY
jgi:hypothetical protein